MADGQPPAEQPPPVEEDAISEISLTESTIIANDMINRILNDDISDDEYLKNEVDPVALIALVDRIDLQKLIAVHLSVQAQKRELMRKNDLLKRNLMKHFRMKKVFRAFNPDNPEAVGELFTRYREGLNQLDTVIASLKRMQEDCSQKLIDVHEQREQMIELKKENLAIQIKEIQDSTMKLQSSQTGHYLPMDELKRFIYRMDNVRERISEVRLLFIKTIDKHTEIDNLAKSLEDLGGGLRMIDFEQLRAERQSLSDKIEERNNELARLRLRCNGDTQILAHVREKEFMLGQDITKCDDQLDQYQEEMLVCRNFVNERKSERDQIRRNFATLSHSCGLLDKPLLLLDYDQVMRQIEVTSQQIDRLKRSIAGATSRMKANQALLNEGGELPRTRSQLKLVGKESRLPWVRQGVPFKRAGFGLRVEPAE